MGESPLLSTSKDEDLVYRKSKQLISVFHLFSFYTTVLNV